MLVFGLFMLQVVSKFELFNLQRRKLNNVRREHGSGVHDDDDVDFFFQRHTSSVGRIGDISSQNIERIGIVVNIVNVNEKIY
jgi:uncharacterized protein (UPF0218 family)